MRGLQRGLREDGIRPSGSCWALTLLFPIGGSSVPSWLPVSLPEEGAVGRRSGALVGLVGLHFFCFLCFRSHIGILFFIYFNYTSDETALTPPANSWDFIVLFKYLGHF